MTTLTMMVMMMMNLFGYGSEFFFFFFECVMRVLPNDVEKSRFDAGKQGGSKERKDQQRIGSVSSLSEPNHAI